MFLFFLIFCKHETPKKKLEFSSSSFPKLTHRRSPNDANLKSTRENFFITISKKREPEISTRDENSKSYVVGIYYIYNSKKKRKENKKTLIYDRKKIYANPRHFRNFHSSIFMNKNFSMYLCLNNFSRNGFLT